MQEIKAEVVDGDSSAEIQLRKMMVRAVSIAFAFVIDEKSKFEERRVFAEGRGTAPSGCQA